MGMRPSIRSILCLCLCLTYAAAHAHAQTQKTGSSTLADPAWALSPATADAVKFKFGLKGYVFGIRLIKADYEGFYNSYKYNVRAKLQTSGIAALLKKLTIWANTEGRLDSSDLHPRMHVQQNLDKKNRRVEMNYDYTRNAVTVDIDPPLGSQGIPPATTFERFHAEDTLSAILEMMLKGQKLNGGLCNGNVRVFDSKQHYNLRMVPDGFKQLKFKGVPVQTLRCLVYYEPISGFDPEDLPEKDEQDTPVKVYFNTVPDQGLHIPLRFTYKIKGFTAVIKVTDLEVIPPRPSDILRVSSDTLIE